MPHIIIGGITRLLCCFISIPWCGCVDAIGGDVCGLHLTETSDNRIDAACTKSNKKAEIPSVFIMLEKEQKCHVKPVFAFFEQRFVVASIRVKYKMVSWLIAACDGLGIPRQYDLTPNNAIWFLKENDLL